MIGVEYYWKSPNHYDGVSEWECLTCHSRVGRWTGNILKEGEEEPKYGERKLEKTLEDCPKCLKETSLSL